MGPSAPEPSPSVVRGGHTRSLCHVSPDCKRLDHVRHYSRREAGFTLPMIEQPGSWESRSRSRLRGMSPPDRLPIRLKKTGPLFSSPPSLSYNPHWSARTAARMGCWIDERSTRSQDGSRRPDLQDEAGI